MFKKSKILGVRSITVLASNCALNKPMGKLVIAG